MVKAVKGRTHDCQEGQEMLHAHLQTPPPHKYKAKEGFNMTKVNLKPSLLRQK